MRAVAHHAVEAAGHLDQHLVADPVAVEVVDVLEPVEVDEQQRGRGRVTALAHRVQPVEQQPPVGEAGERVVQRRVRGRAVGALLLVQPLAQLPEQPVVVQRRRHDRAHLGDELDVLGGVARLLVPRGPEQRDRRAAHAQGDDDEAHHPVQAHVLAVRRLHERPPLLERRGVEDDRLLLPPHVRQHPDLRVVRHALAQPGHLRPAVRQPVVEGDEVESALVVLAPQRGGVADEVADPAHDLLLQRSGLGGQVGQRAAEVGDAGSPLRSPPVVH
nr:hypothetical protein [Actinomycetota bacterium]